MLPLIIAFASFLTTLILMPRVIKAAYRFGILDYPGNDKIHSRAVPRIGGIAIFAGFFPWALILLYLNRAASAEAMGIISGVALIFLVGLSDDIFSLLPRYKFPLQTVAALIPILSGLRLELGLPGWFVVPFSLFFILGASNSLNLIDGLDGLAGGVTLICTASFLLLFVVKGNPVGLGICMVLMGSVFGFIPFNLKSAKAYMGDGGSLLLGFLLGILAITAVNEASNKFLAVISVVLILGFPVYDTLLSIVRRVARKRRVSSADLGHTYNKLMSHYGLSQVRTVIVCYAASLLLGLLGILLYFSSPGDGFPVMVALMVFSCLCTYKLRLYA